MILRKIREVIQDTGRQMKQAQLLMVASSLAYTTILSIIPLLAVSFSIFKAFGGMNKLYNLIEPVILSNLAEGTSEEVIATLHKFIDNAHAGAVGVGGLVGLIFTSMSMLSSIENAINHVWQAPVTRSLFHRISSYWLFITLGPLGLSVAVGIATSSDVPLVRLFPSGTGMFLLGTGVFFSIYKWVPQTRVEWKYASVSSLFTSLLWYLARYSYGIYTQKVVTYNTVYGSLGAIPILLLWIYIVWVIILGGVALTAALQKRISTSLNKI